MCYEQGMKRLAVFSALLAVAVSVSSDVSAEEPTQFFITMHGEGRVRLEVAAGRTTPCDSSNNTRVFDGWINGGETFTVTRPDDCVCVRSTTKKFPSSGWSTPGLACRKRICRGRVCRPSNDPTVHVNLSTDG